MSYSVAVPIADAGDRVVLGLLRRAAALRSLAACFAYPRPGHRADVQVLLEPLADDGPFAALAAAWSAADEDVVRAAYSRLFLGIASCTPNETTWGDARRLAGVGAELADIQGFYRAFGFELAAAGHDMADHVGAELEFVAALLIKAAYARAEGWDAAGQVAADGARAFLEAHLGRWTPALVERLCELEPGPPYLETAAALGAAVSEACQALGARPEPGTTGSRAYREPDAFACPLADSCAALGQAPETA